MRITTPGAVALCTALLVAAACSDTDSDEISPYSAGGHEGRQATATMIAADGSEIGNATFQQGTTGVLITVEVSGLAPGAHGIHLHAAGACTPDLRAAGGHLNPDEGVHGLLNGDRTADGQDNGDLPNLYAAADGSAQAEFFTTLVTIAGGTMPELLDGDGSTLVIHENPDDHTTQPIGGAGGRVACGVIG